MEMSLRDDQSSVISAAFSQKPRSTSALPCESDRRLLMSL
ncbi:unnamed protein product, partial [Rotaria socialis]